MKPQKNCSMLATSTKILGFLLLIMLCTSSDIVVQGEEHFYEFIVSEKNFTKLCETKSTLVVNGGFPGPEIRVHKGDTVFVNVHNEGYYGFTIHWHGVKQPRNPWSDGPEFVTQCPISPGTNFTYEINFTDEIGTLWWHAHSDWTRATVHGAIVILPAEGTTYPFPEPDEDETLIIASWYLGDLHEVIDLAMQDGRDLFHSDAYTLNGECGDLCPCSKETTYRRVVEYGKTYLLRLINTNMNSEQFFAIGGHNFTVVGMDGAYIKPIDTSYLVIIPGQSMDILLVANQSPGQYYMASRQFTTEDPVLVGFDYTNATAILEYSSNSTYQTPPLYPTTLPFYWDYQTAMNFTHQIRSLATTEYPIDVPVDVTTRMYITVSMGTVYCDYPSCEVEEQIAASANNISWVDPEPSSNVLQAYYQNISGVYTTDFPDEPPTFYNFTGTSVFDEGAIYLDRGTKVKVLNYNESVEIVFQGTNVGDASMNHPMHIHGHVFYVVGYGDGNFDNVTDPDAYNLVDPPAVNTFDVPKRGWLAIRFKANNPGVWFWHCHLDRHLTWGMNGAFIVKNGGTTESTMREPPSYGMPECAVSLNSRVRDYGASVEN